MPPKRKPSRRRRKRGNRPVYKDCEQIKKRIKDSLAQYFGPYEEQADHGLKFDWNCIHHSTHYLSNHVKDLEAAYLHVDYVFRLFEKYRCTDSPLIEDWLDIYCKLRYSSYGFWAFRQVQRTDQLDFVYSRVRASGSVRVPSYEYEYKNFTVSGLVLKPFLMQDEELVEILLRYKGASRYCMQKNVDLYHYMRDVLKRFVNDPVFGDQVTSSSLYKPKPLRNEIRLGYIFMGIDVILQKRLGNQRADQSIRSLKRLFRAITEPLITAREIDRVLNIFLESDVKNLIIEEFCGNFLEHFPKGAEPLQPRKLMHLCRVFVRKQLKRSRMLPYGVSHLDIPNSLQSYLLLEL